MANVSIKWLGHAGFIIILPEGKLIIIDPWIVDNPLCPIKLNEIKAADIVLVTHDHLAKGETPGVKIVVLDPGEDYVLE